MIEEFRFDPLVYADEMGLDLQAATKEARRHRDSDLREMRKSGMYCKGSSVTGQLRKYRSYGVPDGRTRTIYYITVYPTAQ